jgi:hypothetical protein
VRLSLASALQHLGEFNRQLSQDAKFCNCTPITSKKSLEPQFLINHQFDDTAVKTISKQRLYEK